MLGVKPAEMGKKITDHFTEDEIACRCCGMVLVHPELVEKLEVLRRMAGGLVVVTSGYRCPKHNRAVGGAENSYHTRGMAADIWAGGVSIRRLAELAERAGFGGIGVYPEQYFVHVDVRGYRVRWEG